MPRPGRSGRERLTQRVRHETLERSRVFGRLLHAMRSIQSTIRPNAPMSSSTRRTRKTSSMTHRVPAGWGEGGGGGQRTPECQPRLPTTLYASDSTHHGSLSLCVRLHDQNGRELAPERPGKSSRLSDFG